MSPISLISNAATQSVVLSVIVPYYNEIDVLPEFHARLTRVLDSIADESEIIYVDDGSTDGSKNLVDTLPVSGSKVVSIGLSRNFGKENAMSAGLEHSQGLAVILIDADLQDPPELIPSMLKEWRKGNDVVNMQRIKREGESWVKRKSAAMFYRLLNWVSKSEIPENVGDFRLLSRQVVDHINAMPERNRYMKGMFVWPGFKQTTIVFKRYARHSGKTKWNYFKLIGLAMDGITSFSISPLRLATVLGSIVAASAFFYGMVIILKTLVFGVQTQGYASMMVVELALGGVQLLCIGLLGEYIGRIFIEAKRRPLYIVQSVNERTNVTRSQGSVAERRA
ncbi:glycosyltransferase family 2 protein [Vibrio sp. S4M6]|uniref:glycosyltransferase family 2 protein n=1 Tax=Vibrio sinus TaxID=2946865 RepID=UPI002029C8A5|nr:glycosyltransferase family 2 protein [Vibrio sinus]MCL9782732.1 glycosyltransferase family 2 protein [Vibrio sinus]